MNGDQHPLDGVFCPACGREDLYFEEGFGTEKGNRILCGYSSDCPRPTAASEILSDPEIHHIVRFDPDSGTFNVKHPLRERIGGELLDCTIHEVVLDAIEDGRIEPEGTWELRGIAPVYIPGGPDQEADWDWEPLS